MTYLATEHGFLSVKHQRIAEIINEYDPDLSLSWIPPNQRELGDAGKEFAVVHVGKDGRPYVAMFVPEDEVDERLIAKLWASDERNGNVLNKLDAMNAAVQAVKLKEQMDVEEERADLARHIWNSPKTRYKHDGVVYE